MKIWLKAGIWPVLCLFLGLMMGRVLSDQTATPISVSASPEIAILELKSVAGDELELEIFGPVRVLWAEDKMLEAEGLQTLPLGQILHDQDQPFLQFAYTANAKTGKFYPSNSYPARGTAVRDRRFFQTKDAAIVAGFIPTKLVK